MAKMYNEEFYKNRDTITRYSAYEILSILSEICSINSVCDVGCGVGTWIAAADSIFELQGAVKGFDGDYVNRELLEIDQKNFISVDLENRLSYIQKFDLVICLEVAEHLSQGRAETFVEDLVNLGDMILFGAAIPHQGGIGHVNEQPLSYWKEKFERRGYRMFDIVRPKVWNDKEILGRYKQNTVLYVKEESKEYEIFASLPVESIVDIVCPDMWNYMYGMYIRAKKKEFMGSIKYKLRQKWGKWKN